MLTKKNGLPNPQYKNDRPAKETRTRKGINPRRERALVQAAAGPNYANLICPSILALSTASLLLLPPHAGALNAPAQSIHGAPELANSTSTPSQSLQSQLQPHEIVQAPPVILSSSDATEKTAPSPLSGIIRKASILLPSDAEADGLPQPPKTFPPLPAIQLPQYTEATLPNGLRVVLLEDHEVPVVRGSILMRGGQYASPSDKVGLATLSSALQRGGGSEQYPTQVLDEGLEGIAAGIEASAGKQASVLSFSCPTGDTHTVLQQFNTLITSPALPAPRLEFYKTQMLEALEHQNDDADATAARKLRQLMYGQDSIYARQPTPESIRSITTDDVRKFLQQWERPDNSVLGIVGDFDPRIMLQEVQEVMGGWQAAPGQPTQPPQVQLPSDPLAPAIKSAGKVYLIDRPGATQASVFAAEPGVSLSDPDATALDVLGGMLSSFGGTLFDEIRSREGLAYSISGGWQSPPGHPGLFVAQAETSQPGALLKGLRKVLAASATMAPGYEEVTEAKERRLNNFVFDFSSKSGQLVRTLIYELLGLPRDLLLKYKEGLEAVQPSDLLKAAQAHLHPDLQVTVILADAKAVKGELKAAGFDVVPLDV